MKYSQNPYTNNPSPRNQIESLVAMEAVDQSNQRPNPSVLDPEL
jgi:hypothetical protein